MTIFIFNNIDVVYYHHSVNHIHSFPINKTNKRYMNCLKINLFTKQHNLLLFSDVSSSESS